MPTLPLLLLLATHAQALGLERELLDWSSFGHTAAAEDAQAQGPVLLHAGPGERVALYDPVHGEIAVLQPGHAPVRIPVHSASDLVLLPDGLLALDPSTRALTSWSLDGRLRSRRALPPLVPTSVTLALAGDQVLAVDIFGQGHPAATLADGDLGPPALGKLQRRPDAVRWDGRTLSTEGLQLDLPDAIVASGQRFGDWLVVDEVVDDAPIAVIRTAWHVPTRQAQDLPVEGRLYAPRGDCAATPGGALLVLVPKAEGLELLRVKP
ncbi:MAG: hypothetical protein ABIO70_01420 [Pseudomonadota bacterium]